MKILVCTSTSLLLRSKPYTDVTGTFLRFQTQERVLSVNKSKIANENTFNGDPFEIEGNHGSSKDKKTLF